MMTTDSGFKIVIPARYGSTRLPAKPLISLADKPMIQHVYECALKTPADDILVATDHEAIYEAVKNFGGAVCMTSTAHRSGTDRIAEVAEQQGWDDEVVVVNLQGDEPMTPPENITQVACALAEHPEAGIATLCLQEPYAECSQDPNKVKVVRDYQGYALYFSRAPIPWKRDPADKDVPAWVHVDIYAYRVRFLKQYTQMPACAFESIEQLEQLRALWHGTRIFVDEARQQPGLSVDTLADKVLAEALMAQRNEA